MTGEALVGWLQAMLTLSWVVVIGSGWAILLRPRSGIAERLSFGYLLGLGLVVTTMLGWQLSGGRYAPTQLFLLSVLVGLPPYLGSAWLRVRRGQARGTSRETLKHVAAVPAGTTLERLVNLALMGAIGLVVLMNLAVATYQPTLRWDEISHHMFAAKIYFHEGGITRDSGMLTQDVRTYPPFVPLTRTWLYELVGSDNPTHNHLVSWAMFASFLAFFYARLRDIVSSTTGLLFTLIASLLMFWGGTESLIDFPLITYGGLGVLSLAVVLRRPEGHLAFVAGLLLGIAGIVRPDGLSFGLLNLGLFGLFALLRIRTWSGLSQPILAVAGFALAVAPWVAFKSAFWGLPLSGETYLGGGFGEMVLAAVRMGSLNTDVLVRVLGFVFPHFNSQYGYVLLFALIIILLGFPDRRTDGFLCTAVLINGAVYMTALYAFLLAGRTDLALREETAIRFGTRLLPLLVFVIGASPLVDEVIQTLVRWRPGPLDSTPVDDPELGALGA
ncbi:MAG: hypothetical protein ACKVVP_11220 [Chloroflexota bacterium]